MGTQVMDSWAIPRQAALSAVRFAECLFVGVFAARAFTSSSIYFSDGPLHLAAIEARTYVIQAPGYWLFARTASLFPNPEIAISIMNWVFSAAGVVFFYLAARKLASETVARLGALLYAAVFFAWFSGNVHTTAASQLFFPIASFYFALNYRENQDRKWLILAGIAFVLGAGFRPSDGIFVAPVFLYALVRARRKDAIFAAATTFVVGLSWLVPQQLALRAMANPIHKHVGSQLMSLANGFLISGLSQYAFTNALRYILPLALALFPLIPLIFRSKSLPLWLWVLPASTFFLLVYIAEATYMNCMLAPLILLAITAPQVSDQRKIRLLAAAICLNLVFYLAWRPIQLQNPRLQKAEYVVESDAGKYTYFSVRNHRQLTLSELLHVPTFYRH